MTCYQWAIIRFCQQQGLPCGSIGTVKNGTSADCWWFSGHPSLHTNSSSAPSWPEHLWSDPVGPSATKHVLTRWGLPRSPRGLAWHQRSRVRTPPDDALDSRTHQTHATSNIVLCRMPWWAGTSISCQIPYNRGWAGHYQNNRWELRKNMQLLIRTYHSAKADLGE